MAMHSGENRDQCVPNAETNDPAILEEALRSAVSDRIGVTRFSLWFGGNVRLLLSRDGDSLIVHVPDSFFRDWIERHYTSSLVDAVQAILGRRLRVLVQILDENELGLGHSTEPESRPHTLNIKNQKADGFTSLIPGNQRLTRPASLSLAESPTRSRSAQSAIDQLNQSRIGSQSGRLALSESTSRPLRRIEDFVTGSSNRIAVAAASEIAQSAGLTFNPLMIHSGIGLGKTHLLEGINNSLGVFHPKLQIVQLNAEAFTNSFVESMRTGTLNGFRADRTAGGLIVDDVQFLAAKRATMLEFLYTFDALYNKGAPIILAADQHPRQISRLTDELVTRFLGGMVVRIEPPDLVTRQAILRAKANARGIEVPDSVVVYIAEHLRASIRELEGALYTVITQSILTGRRLDVSLAQCALRESIRHTIVSIGIRDVERVVCNLFQVKPEALRSEVGLCIDLPSYDRNVPLSEDTGAAYSEIGRHFGGRNHTTVIAAEKKVNKWVKSEKRIVLLPGFETIADLLSDLERV